MNKFYRELVEASNNIKETGTIEFKENLFKDLAEQIIAFGDELAEEREEARVALHQCIHKFDPRYDYTEGLNRSHPYEKEVAKTYFRDKNSTFKIYIDIDEVTIQVKTRHPYDEKFENILVINKTGAEVLDPTMVKLCLSLVPTIEISNTFVEAWKNLEHEYKRTVVSKLNKAWKDIVEGRCILAKKTHKKETLARFTLN